MRHVIVAAILAVGVLLALAESRRQRTAPALTTVAASEPDPLPGYRPLYDADPEHLWNRIDRHLRLRTDATGGTHGVHDVDPLLWHRTRYLLEGPSHERALALIDEFLNTNADRLVVDPVRRALLQRDVWAVFDWAVSTTESLPDERRRLAAGLARVLRRLGLTRAELESVAITSEDWRPQFDGYAAVVATGRYPITHDPEHPDSPFLPADLFADDGPWVPVQGSVALPQHSGEMSRSAFAVLLNMPGGRRDTLAYLKRLWDAPQPFVVDPISPRGESRTTIDPALNDVPGGTQVALVRSMLHLDTSGAIHRSRIIESVQLRVFRHATPRPLETRSLSGGEDQHFHEFVMDRWGLISNEPALRAMGRAEQRFLTFSSHGIDAFERDGPAHGAPLLQMCGNCHQESGLASILSARRFFRPFSLTTGARSVLDGNPEWWKMQRADWGKLQAYWDLQPW